MANSKKSLNLVLDTQALEEDFFEDTSLYAIRFSEHGYYVIWLINKLMNINFTLNKNYFSENDFKFTQYQFLDLKNDLQHFIYTNRNQGNFLVRELRGFHFFWLVKGASNRNKYMLDAIKKINENSEVDIIQQLDLETLAQRNNFLF
jgi:hypothetical protein